MTNKKRLGQRLLEKGLITGEELSEALLEQSLTGEKLGRVLVKLKMISESTLNELLGIKEMSPGEAIDQQLLRIIPEELIRRSKVNPPLHSHGRYLECYGHRRFKAGYRP
jgi:type IV pilus assembly protein PilB